jgi:hypothetical protein
MKACFVCRILTLIVVISLGASVTLEVHAQQPAEATAGRALVKGYDDLVNLLKQENVKHKADATAKAVALGVRSGDLEAPMLIRWQESDGLVQFVQTMPFEIPAERIAAMENAITRVNHALAFAGFGMDHRKRTMYFRMSVPFQPRGALEAREVSAYMQGTIQQAATFYLPFKRVALEGASPEGVLEDAKKEMAKRKQEPQE